LAARLFTLLPNNDHFRKSVTLKLSKRLTKIEALITADYSHIWDTCCDHGFLGTVLISHQKAPNIHFVDILPKLITPLHEKLSHLFSNPHHSSNLDSHSHEQTHWQTHCLDLAEIPLQHHPGKHLIIIAGIGGDLMIGCMKNIMSKHPDVEIDFIICPVRHLYTLRQQLIELKMTLKKEVLVKENKKIYEILLLSNASLPAGQLTPLKPVSPIGESIWQGNTAEEKNDAQEYLAIKIKHYQRMQPCLDNPDINKIIEAYQNITQFEK
jgi:tRNA (adenine22-N1)-methyltransferase